MGILFCKIFLTEYSHSELAISVFSGIDPSVINDTIGPRCVCQPTTIGAASTVGQILGFLRLLVQKSIVRLYTLSWVIILVMLLTGCASTETEPAHLPTLAALAVVPPSTHTPTPTLPPTGTPEKREFLDPHVFLPSLTPEPSPIPPITLEPVFHEVHSGETLLGIALEYGVTLDSLMIANGLTNPGLLQVGQRLQIPPVDRAAEDGLPAYYVQVDDNFFTIAHRFNIDVEMLMQANPAVEAESLQVGQVLYLPLDVHIVAWGETLSEIAGRYQVSLDDLFLANRGKIDPANPNLVLVGTVLEIPREHVREGYDCSPQSGRTAVIEYIVQPGEQRICLEQKFSVSATTILYANLDRVMGEDMFKAGAILLIPPNDGALYIITAEDVRNNVTQEDLVRWYGIQRFDYIVDWQGAAVPPVLQEGQQLFIRNADLQAGPFRSSTLARLITQSPVSPPSSGVPSAPPAAGDTSQPSNPGYSPPVGGAQPAGTLTRMNKDVWDGANPGYDLGYCSPADGSGWSGSLSWPSANRVIREERGFRPGHPAIDIIGEIGDPVYAAETGLVTWAGFSSWGGGYVIVLAHGNTWRTYYAHLDKVMVSCGQAVTKGALIGQIGKTGTGWPHLHFEVQQGAYNHNPLNWLSGATFGSGDNTPFNRQGPVSP